MRMLSFFLLVSIRVNICHFDYTLLNQNSYSDLCLINMCCICIIFSRRRRMSSRDEPSNNNNINSSSHDDDQKVRTRCYPHQLGEEVRVCGLQPQSNLIHSPIRSVGSNPGALMLRRFYFVFISVLKQNFLD